MTATPAWLAAELQRLSDDNLVRPRREMASLGPGHGRVDGVDIVDFSSNDYLGLARHPRLQAAAQALPSGAGASPLVSGRSPQYARLESELAAFEHTESALLFPSGFAANLGSVSALVGPGDVVFSDHDNHASLIDGCRLSRARIRVYKRQHLDTLHRQLTDAADAPRRLIVTDSLFSMDGVLAPLPELAQLADAHDAMLLVDEAHATGVLGRVGRGACEALDVEDKTTIRIGTLSKSLGTAGGFAVGSRTLLDYLWHRARPQVFSTALPPATCAAALEALKILQEEPIRREHLSRISDRLRQGVRDLGLQDASTHGPIVTVMLGDPTSTLEASQQLLERGHFVPAIRPPTVKPGTSRLRISLSAAHTESDIDNLLTALAPLSSSARCMTSSSQ